MIKHNRNTREKMKTVSIILIFFALAFAPRLIVRRKQEQSHF